MTVTSLMARVADSLAAVVAFLHLSGSAEQGAYTVETTSGNDAVDDQHSLVCTLVLHLLPGALITAFYVAAAPLVRSVGFPSVMAIFLITVLLITWAFGLIMNGVAGPVMEEVYFRGYLLPRIS
jgi:hypothetical protein